MKRSGRSPHFADALLAELSWTVVETEPAIAPAPAFWSDGMLATRGDPSHPDVIWLNASGIADFRIDFAAHEIGVAVFNSPSTETIEHLLLDQVLPRIRAHQGSLVLHAAGVSIGGDALLFVGRSGAGKSTLAASLHTAGHQLLGDDAFVVASNARSASVAAVYPSLRLYPDSVVRVLAEARTSEVADYLDKVRVLDVGGPLEKPHPLKAIFILDPGMQDEARAHPIDGAESCMALVQETFALNPADPRRGRDRLNDIAHLIETVPVYRLVYPRSYHRLGEVHDAILAAPGLRR